jgi:acyl carrier protein
MDKIDRTDAGLRATLREFLSSTLLPLSNAGPYGDEDSFLEKGILDSTGVLELVGYIEKTFAIRVEADEIVPDNLDSIQKLVAFIGRKAAPARS